LIQRLVAFFATGDSIVANNLVLNLYKHINAPEARMYLSRQLYEEALHVQFYLTLLDTYLPEPEARARAFAAVENIPSIRAKAAFCFRWIDAIQQLDRLDTRERRRQFLLNLICFAACIEGLFFFAAFAYVYYLRSRGVLHGLASGTNWVFRDESGHMAFAFEVIAQVRREEPDLFDAALEAQVHAMLDEAIACERQFAEDVLSGGVAGLALKDMRHYLEYVADQRLRQLGFARRYGASNPFAFMDLQDVQELTNFVPRPAPRTPPRIAMLRVSVLYPAAPGARFDLDDYLQRHTPMVEARLGAALKGLQIDRGLCGAQPDQPTPYLIACHLLFDSQAAFLEAFVPHAAEITADIARYTDVSPTIFMSEVLAAR
jgi:ribonucleoside-diphosphate reductase beta chain